MRWTKLILMLLFAWTIAASAQAEEVTYRDYEGKITVAKDAEYIDLGRLKVENYDAFEAFLDQLPNLKRVDMYTTHVFKGQAARLSSRYPHIEFGWTLYFGDHTIRTDQTAFSTLHDGLGRGHTSADMEVLRYCKNLRALDLGHNDLTDLSFLSELDELHLLILADNQITDISVLAELENLEYIELFMNRVTDLTPLSNLTHLMDLNVTSNRVESLEPLYSMPWLKRLWLCEGAGEEVLTSDAVQSLKDALPETYIDTTSLGTEGGWRKHAHYTTLRQIYKENTYIPFDDSFTSTQNID